MATIPLSRYTAFNNTDVADGRRLGQRFHSYMNLSASNDPDVKEWADKLYQLDGENARTHIRAKLDFLN